MELLKEGSVPLQMPLDWNVVVECMNCAATLKVCANDLRLWEWPGDRAVPRTPSKFYLFVVCPCCELRLPLYESQLHPHIVNHLPFPTHWYEAPAKDEDTKRGTELHDSQRWSFAPPGTLACFQK